MSKRGDGEGSIYQREDGRWCAQASIAGRRRTIYGKTRKAVQAKLRALLSDADRGLLPPTERVTVDEYLARWIEDVVAPSVRPRTLEWYQYALKGHLSPTIGHLKLTRLQPAHLQEMYTRMLSKGHAPKTVRNVHGVIHRALSQALTWNLVSRNVADAVQPPRPKRQEMKVLNPDQVRTLLSTSKGTMWGTFLHLALSTGMRLGELRGLQWRDVNLDRGDLHVRRQYGVDRRFSEPKTGKGRRRIALPTSVVESLQEHKRLQAQDRELIGSDYVDQDLVFATPLGRPLPYSTVQGNHKRLLAQAGLPDVRFHDLRHTAATLLLLEGVHPKVVQERMGHSQIAMTLDTYSHLLPSMDREAADRLDKLLD